MAVGSFMVAGVCSWDFLSPILMEKEAESGQEVGLSHQLSRPISDSEMSKIIYNIEVSWSIFQVQLFFATL